MKEGIIRVQTYSKLEFFSGSGLFLVVAALINHRLDLIVDQYRVDLSVRTMHLRHSMDMRIILLLQNKNEI